MRCNGFGCPHSSWPSSWCHVVFLLSVLSRPESSSPPSSFRAGGRRLEGAGLHPDVPLAQLRWFGRSSLARVTVSPPLPPQHVLPLGGHTGLQISVLLKVEAFLTGPCSTAAFLMALSNARATNLFLVMQVSSQFLAAYKKGKLALIILNVEKEARLSLRSVI